MSEINSFSDYASKYNTNMDYSSLFGGGAPYIDNGMGGINVSDYAMIKNGSYGKLIYCSRKEVTKMRKLGKKVTLDKRSLQAYKFCVCSNCPCPSGTSSYSAKASDSERKAPTN